MKITKTLLPISFLLFKSITSFAQWSTDTTINNPICTISNDQSSTKIVPDGSGGAIIVWKDKRNGTSNSDIYAQHIDSNGMILWNLDGIPICTALNEQNITDIISDGNGGAIISWSDYRNNSVESDIYAQKINFSGIIQWTNNGLAICTAAQDNYNPKMVTDGNGGAIITWMDTSNNGDIYAQSINSQGTIQWTINGIVICNNMSQNDFPRIVSDGSNGAIITWQDTRNGNFDIYAQRINSNGVVQWTNNGIVICNAIGSQTNPTIISNSLGAIITWTDSRNSTNPPDIYTQLINQNGLVQWTINGVAICTSVNDQNSPSVVSDGNNGAIITWTDYRTTANSADVYAQRINSAGIVQWTTNGIGISNTNGNQWLTNIVSDGNGGAIITWQDNRGANADIYSQRINSTGNIQWTLNGNPVSIATNNQVGPILISDNNNGAIITWADYRNGADYDVYTQRINMNGNLSIGTQEILNNSLVKVYPNPSNGLISVQSTEKITEFYLLDYFGKIIFKEISQNYNTTKLDLGNLSNGIYIYKVTLENNTVSFGKIIISN